MESVSRALKVMRCQMLSSIAIPSTTDKRGLLAKRIRVDVRLRGAGTNVIMYFHALLSSLSSTANYNNQKPVDANRVLIWNSDPKSGIPVIRADDDQTISISIGIAIAAMMYSIVHVIRVVLSKCDYITYKKM